MTDNVDAPPVVAEVYWRPGCPYCTMLRRDLDRRGVPTVWRNIWEDDEARRLVRRANHGDETVPTVRVGTATLANPAGDDVAALLGLPAAAPGHARARTSALTRGASWLPVLALVAGSEVVSHQGHPGIGLGLDAVAVAAWWLSRSLRR